MTRPVPISEFPARTFDKCLRKMPGKYWIYSQRNGPKKGIEYFTYFYKSSSKFWCDKKSLKRADIVMLIGAKQIITTIITFYDNAKIMKKKESIWLRSLDVRIYFCVSELEHSPTVMHLSTKLYFRFLTLVT